MKAIYLEAHGGLSALKYGDQPDPVFSANEIQVRVRACAVNRRDVFTRSGVRGTKREFRKPLIPGMDVAGDVVATGSAVSNVRVGDRVVLNPVLWCNACAQCLVGRQDFCEHSHVLGSSVNGGYAEYVVVPGLNAHVIPPTLTYREAAALPTTFMPVWNIVVRRAQLKPWESILVSSASAGVGVAAIQVAKHAIGARVLATTSTPEKAALAIEIGADEVINYTQEDITERVMALTNNRGVDVVVDHVGSDFFPKAYAATASGGRYGVCGVTSGYKTELQLGALFTRQITLFGVTMGTPQDLSEVLAAAGAGRIWSRIDRVFPLEHAQDAHRLMEDRTFFGKIILEVP